MPRLLLSLFNLLTGRKLVDPARHPILSKRPELVNAPGVKWRPLSDFAPPGHYGSGMLGNWFIVSVGYTETEAKKAGVPVARMNALKLGVMLGVEEAVRRVCSDGGSGTGPDSGAGSPASTR